jgi:hypothetical protein
VLQLAATATRTVATHSHHSSDLAPLAFLVIAAGVGYLLTCWIWPFGTCRRCHGLGKRRSPIGRAFRHCDTCDGTGYRLRAGRHLITRARHTRRTK